uniref:F-box domain-containing protein n=1 Tax=Guillardia theta TaxID=55529 RepID=A0A7S4L8Q9_GUITH
MYEESIENIVRPCSLTEGFIAVVELKFNMTRLRVHIPRGYPEIRPVVCMEEPGEEDGGYSEQLMMKIQACVTARNACFSCTKSKTVEFERKSDGIDSDNVITLIEAIRCLIDEEDASRAGQDACSRVASRPQSEIVACSSAVNNISSILPTDLLTKVISKIDRSHLLKVSLVCKLFSFAVDSAEIWLENMRRKGWEGQAVMAGASNSDDGSDYAAHCLPLKGGRDTAAAAASAAANIKNVFRDMWRSELLWYMRETSSKGVVASLSRLGDQASTSAVTGLAYLRGGDDDLLLAVGLSKSIHVLPLREFSWREGGGSGDLVDPFTGIKELAVRDHRSYDGKMVNVQSSSDGKSLVAALNNGKLMAWKAGTNGVKRAEDMGNSADAIILRPHKSSIRQFQVRTLSSSHHPVVIAGGDDGCLSVSSVSKQKGGASSMLMRGHGAAITCVDSSKDEATHLLAASGAADGRVKLWDCERGMCLFSAQSDRRGKVAAIALVDPWSCSKENETFTCSPMIIAGMHDGIVNFYDPRASSGQDGRKANLVCSISRASARDPEERIFRCSSVWDKWGIHWLWGQRAMLASEEELLWGRIGFPRRALSTLRCSPNGRMLVTVDTLEELSCFDLRRMGVCVNVQAGETIGRRATSEKTQWSSEEVKKGRFSSELDWKASRIIQESCNFCDVMHRGGFCDLFVDEVKAIVCSYSDATISALDMTRGRFIARGLPHSSSSSSWISPEVTGPCCRFLWSQVAPSCAVVGSMNGVVGVMKLPLSCE